MSEFYVLGIDQSTQGTKGVLLNEKGEIIRREDLPHEQIINEQGWVSHDASEIYFNAEAVLKKVIEKTGVDPEKIKALGITNQRETTVAWDKTTGEPLAYAIVWQCNRATELCERILEQYHCEEMVYARTGLLVSPYYPAAKMAWLLENVEAVKQAAQEHRLALGTIDAYLVYRLTGGKSFRTDYSNASRTQLFNLQTLTWDEEICKMFGIPMEALPKVTDSDGDFGETTLSGYLSQPVKIHGVLGDSHAALYGHNCHKSGDIKVTYGTGSSIMLNIGEEFRQSSNNLSTSLAFKVNGKVFYCLEGNINYTGATISWLKDDVKMITSAGETAELARSASKEDTTYLVPAFTGLGAPWWKNDAKAMIYGMSRHTGRNEIVKAGVESIAYQITDVIEALRRDTGLDISELCVDGGPTANDYLMQFQSDIANASIRIPSAQELSVLGVSFLAGIASGLWTMEEVTKSISYNIYRPKMEEEERNQKRDGWKEAISKLL